MVLAIFVKSSGSFSVLAEADGLSLILGWVGREDFPASARSPKREARRRRRGRWAFCLLRLIPLVKFIHDSEKRDMFLRLAILEILIMAICDLCSGGCACRQVGLSIWGPPWSSF